MNTSLKLSKKLSFGEEIANSVTHAVGAVIMLILLLFHPPIVMKHMDFYHLLVFLSLLSVSFSCSSRQPFTTLWPMVRPTNTSCESSTIL